MDLNLPVWSYYAPSFVDPLFVPYLKFERKDDKGNLVPINTWEKQGVSDGLVNPDIVRKNWGMTFMNKFSNDSCPPMFEKYPIEDGGYCIPRKLGYRPLFYTEKAFIPRNQYYQSYTIPLKQLPRVSESFDMRSVNPFTGHYSIYYDSVPGYYNKENNNYSGSSSNSATQYGRLPTSDSYL